ncbi:hypothetical protein [Falsirhodobacter sp. alg1]|uniref:hypothetical protein n=1 Tax=Falsirhodobacter sp. alg1 TaxID=1472418 RepID=UPI0005EE8563|nr:hypothetical protein [Falsirhodobacter sp. alg1]
MIPGFALVFREDTLVLLHRTDAGWTSLGATPLDVPDLTERLEALRAEAEALAPDGLTTKIALPNSQILYTSVPLLGMDHESQVVAALDGLTPYDPSDLVYDWQHVGGRASLAVIARETLDEAEGFATDNGFNPVAFTAIAPEGRFPAEPWFGTTMVAPRFINGSDPMRDNLMMAPALAGLATAAAVEPAADPVPQPVDTDVELEPIVAAEPVPAPAEDAENATDWAVTPEPADEQVAEWVADEPEAEAWDVPEVPGPTDDPEPEAPVFVPPYEPDPTPAPRKVTDLWAVQDPEPEPEPVTEEIAPLPPEPEPAVYEAPTLGAAPQFDHPSFRPVTAAPIRAERAAPATMERTAPKAPAKSAPRAEPSVMRVTPSVAAPSAADRTVIVPKAEPTVQSPAQAPAVNTPLDSSGVTATSAAIEPPLAAPDMRPPPLRVTDSKPAKRPADMPDKTGKEPHKKPRFLGLFLTVLLLAGLAIIGAVSAYYADAKNKEAAAAALSTAAHDAVAQLLTDPAPAAQEAADQAISDPVTDQADVALAQLPVAAEEPSVLQSADTTQLDIAADTAPAPEPDTTAGILTASATEDAHPVLPANPPTTDVSYELDAAGQIIPTPDGVVTPDGVTLVAGLPPRTPPDRPASFSGPDTPDATTTASAAPAAAAFTVAASSDADPALANARPRLRPATVKAAAVIAQDEPVLPPVARAITVDPSIAAPPFAVADSRPAARPDTVEPAAAAPVMMADAAVLASPRPQTRPTSAAETPSAPLNVASASLVSQDTSPSATAVEVSQRPELRPSGISRDSVQAALAAAMAAPPATPAPTPAPSVRATQQAAVRAAPAATPAPAPQATTTARATPAPEPVPTAPRIPTTASVASNATQDDVLAMNRTNVISISGSETNRTALVRQSNGRIARVSIGDRLDGGVVAAITENAVHYRKGNKLYAIEMPRG